MYTVNGVLAESRAPPQAGHYGSSLATYSITYQSRHLPTIDRLGLLQVMYLSPDAPPLLGERHAGLSRLSAPARCVLPFWVDVTLARP